MGRHSIPMETLIGLVTKDATIVLADRSAARSIIRFQDEKDKVKQLDQFKVMASAEKKGGDSVQFGEYVQKNLKLYELRTSTSLSTHAAANFVRGELARFLRQRPYYVDLLIGGWDKDDGPSLYYLDSWRVCRRFHTRAMGTPGTSARRPLTAITHRISRWRKAWTLCVNASTKSTHAS